MILVFSIFSILFFTHGTHAQLIGETGSITLENRNTALIEFENSYNQTPIIIGIVATQNNDDSPFIPIIHSINTTHANISLCRDNGASTCDNSYNSEIVHYMIFDVEKTNEYSWIEAGRINATTDGGTNSISFSKTFGSAPYIFALPQTYNINSVVANGIGAVSRFNSITTTDAEIIPCDHPGTANACAGTATEEFGYIAIDISNHNFSKFDFGSQTISNSDWTSVSYSQTYLNPIITVMANSRNGAEETLYPWARNVGTSGAQIRYCEADGANDCDGHIGELTRWMLFERGPIFVKTPPSNLEINVSKEKILINESNLITARVSNIEGNSSVETVIATILDPLSNIYNISLNPQIVNRTKLQPDIETNKINYTANEEGDILGETGKVTLQNRNTTLIEFENTYNQTPIIIAIAATQNNDNSPFIPIVHSINTTHANISLCRDNGASTCDNLYDPEIVHYMIFDVEKANNYSWMEIGRINVTPNGNTNAITFSKTFSNAPYMFGLPQTYNIGSTVSDGIGAMSWFPSITTTSATIVGCDHPGTADTCAGTATEEFAYIAIDVNNHEFPKFDYGNQTISDSAWTSVSYSQTYLKPIISVMVNSENGPQDPAYPWARNINPTQAEIRYCEADTANYCDTHNGEITRWILFEEGLIKIGSGGLDNETEIILKEYPYLDLKLNDFTSINSLNFIAYVDSYSNNGSVERGNNNPELKLEFLMNLTWENIGSFNTNGVGNFNLNITNKTIINSWLNSSTRILRISGINLDYLNETLFDVISYNSLNLNVYYSTYSGIWNYNFSNTEENGIYNITHLHSTNSQNLTNTTQYSNVTFEVIISDLEIELISPINNSKIISNGEIELNWNINSSDSNLTCDIYINSILNQTQSCNSGSNNTLVIEPESGEYNWTVNVTDSNNVSSIALEEDFLIILNKHSSISKIISSINTDLYLINLYFENKLNLSQEIRIIDFVNNKFNYGSFSIMYNWINITNGL